jgi:F0F1-type ATP synthase membrane subunit c/vacuolar-type H+-ATPase subunit K
MRAFAFACLVLAGIAVGSAAIVLGFVQQSVSTAFAEPTARV